MQQYEILDEIAAERRRQIEIECWSREHDDEHVAGELAAAAATYAAHAARDENERRVVTAAPLSWPWHGEWWKPKTARRDLVRAAALIIAEIERLDRVAIKAVNREPSI